MTAEIKSFRGAVPPGQPVPEVVELLEGLLERARRGDIQAVAFAAVLSHGNGTSTGWDSNDGLTNDLGAALSQLHHRFYASGLG